MSPTDSAGTRDPLGHEVLGTGPARVVVMNDWLCDTSTWNGARPYLDGARFTFAFADLRGYGRSRGRAGDFTLLEAARDVLALADALGWTRFAVVGHSMSSLVALHLAQTHPDRIARAVAFAYERGKAINMASLLEIDGVIDPADTRAWIARGMKSVPAASPKRRFIDTW